ncbi:MAG: bactofilin family protein [Bdellovibrionota bacterium]|jgi:cytoskeletal protein CcmA (bactofilin family)
MMMNLKKPQQSGTITLLDKGCEFQGKLSFEGVVRIDGIFRGEIFSHDHLIIGEGAQVDANIHVGTLEIGGRFKGNIIARDALIVHKTGRIEGQIETKDLEAHPGCVLDGSLKMSDLKEPSVKPSLSPVTKLVATPDQVG